MTNKLVLWAQIISLWATVITGLILAAWTDIRNHRWLQHDPSLPWSMLNLSDAQRRTLLWIGVFFILILLTWRGVPYGVRYHHRGTNRESIELRKLQVLWPMKILTVLFHEMSHAIVGMLTGGKVLYIGVNASEHGMTDFDPDHRLPHIPVTLSAGYIGSCVIGCGMLLAGFDSLASKIASLVLCGWILICLIICIAVKPKLFMAHQTWRVKVGLARLRCQPKAAEYYRQQAGRDEKGETYEDRMVSLDIIFFVTAILLLAIIASWYLYDSIYLRYVLLFMGVGSSTYAIWDVLADGILRRGSQDHPSGTEDESDCTKMAEYYNSGKAPGRKRSPLYYAVWWLMIQIIVTGTTILIGLATIRYTVVEQAIRSRQFVPTPHHYEPADLFRSGDDVWSFHWPGKDVNMGQAMQV